MDEFANNGSGAPAPEAIQVISRDGRYIFTGMVSARPPVTANTGGPTPPGPGDRSFGIDQPPLAVDTGTRKSHNPDILKHWPTPGRGGVHGEPFEEGTVGRPITAAGYCPTGYDRSITPESLLADGCIDPTQYVCDKARALAPWLANARADQMMRRLDDYTQVGTTGQLRATLEQLYSLGHFVDAIQPGVLAGANSIATFPLAPFSVGVRLDWGINLQQFAPFDMNIQTQGAQAIGALLAGQNIVADRQFSARVSQVTGGSVYFPWAVRGTPGMSVAQQVIASATPVEGVALLVRVNGLPAAIQPFFSMQATLLTAFHPITASYATAYGAFSGGK